MLTIIDLRNMNDKELAAEMKKLKKELLKTTYELKINQREDTDKPKKLRRQIAQINTIMNEPKLEVKKSVQPKKLKEESK
jgi:ribosomal protein L29